MILHIDSIMKNEWKFYGLMVDELSPGTRIENYLVELSNRNGNIVIYNPVPRGENTLILWSPIEPIEPPKGSHTIG
jgi:hypothetical protein